METHSVILAWKIPWTEEPGGLQCMGLQKSQTWVSDWTSKQYSIVYMYHNFFIHSFVDGHLGCFDVTSIVNRAAINTGAIVVVFQLLSQVWPFETPWTAACQAFLSFTISLRLLELMSIASVMPSNHLILCCPFLLLPSIFPSIRVFSSELALCTRWPKHWSFSFSTSPSNEYSGLISFRIDWFDLHDLI